MVSVTKTKAGGGIAKHSSSTAVRNPFKDDKEPGWLHYGFMFGMAMLVTAAFLLWTDQGKNDVNDFHNKVADFHDKHIRKHVDSLKEKYHKSRRNKQLSTSHGENGATTQDTDHQRIMEHLLKKHPEKKKINLSHDHHHESHKKTSHHDQKEGGKEHEQENGHHNKKNKVEKKKENEFPVVSLAEFPKWLSSYAQSLDWSKQYGSGTSTQLNHLVLQQSLELGCQYLIHNQKEAGNFVYDYNFVTKTMASADSQVRQAGALWGLSLCFQQLPHQVDLQKAVDKGLDFFVLQNGHSHEGDDEKVGTKLYIQYPKESLSSTGTNALVGLALIEYLRKIKDKAHNVEYVDPERLKIFQNKLAEIVNLLHSLQLAEKKEGHFAKEYDTIFQKPLEGSSPYADGEALLCLIKAVKYGLIDDDGKNKELLELIQESAPALFKAYSVDAWHNHGHDSDLTKGFYQWSSMAAAEYYTATGKGWEKDRQLYKDYIVTMAHWVVHTHKILKRNRNTGYAYEGLLSAYQILDPKNDNDKKIRSMLLHVIDQGLRNISTWQVGGPLAHSNLFLKDHESITKSDPKAIGGVMNAHDEPSLRIDTTQHQMHSVIMALHSGIFSPTGTTVKR